MSSRSMPKWADVLLVPLISLAIAFAISALVILAIGEDPVHAMVIMEPGKSSLSPFFLSDPVVAGYIPPFFGHGYLYY